MSYCRIRMHFFAKLKAPLNKHAPRWFMLYFFLTCLLNVVIAILWFDLVNRISLWDLILPPTICLAALWVVLLTPVSLIWGLATGRRGDFACTLANAILAFIAVAAINGLIRTINLHQGDLLSEGERAFTAVAFVWLCLGVPGALLTGGQIGRRILELGGPGPIVLGCRGATHSDLQATIITEAAGAVGSPCATVLGMSE